MTSKFPQEDVRLLALFVHHGKCGEERARKVMALAGREGITIEAALIRQGVIKEGEWKIWKTTGGVPPELTGYEILRRLGEGGCAKVFLGRDGRGVEVVLKIAHSEVVANPESADRFLREGKMLGRLRHPGIVKATKVARQGDKLYLVLEYIDGETALDRLMRRESFKEGEALDLVLEVAKALGYLAEEGIVHRDVKPGNIMVARDGRVMLLDLGFATPSGGGGDEEMETSGTAHYMAPEQAKGDEVDQRTDIYSLGVTLFHLVTGELPFENRDKREVMRSHIKDRLSSTSLKDRSFTPLLAYFIQKMTAKDKEIRYQSPKELVEDLQEKIKGFKEIRDQGRVDRVERPKRPRRRRR